MEGLLSHLPARLRRCVTYYQERGHVVEEVCLHPEEAVLLVTKEGNLLTGTICSDTEFENTFFSLCQGSLYAHAKTISQGYISVEGGYRVGVCGNAVGDEKEILTLKQITSLHLRLSRIVPDCAKELYLRLKEKSFSQSVLLYAPPGVGKTTLLRDLAKQLATPPDLQRVCVVDSRRELGYGGLFCGSAVDLLYGYPRAQGMEIAVRTLSAQYILCDEIGNAQEGNAILTAMHAGVHIVATAHAQNLQGLLLRAPFAELHKQRAFSLYCGLQKENGVRKLSFSEWREQI